MKKILALAILVITTASLHADCPFSVTCSLDGGMMMAEQTYYSGAHKSVKFSHREYVGGKQEYHYVIVQCD